MPTASRTRGRRTGSSTRGSGAWTLARVHRGWSRGARLAGRGSAPQERANLSDERAIGGVERGEAGEPADQERQAEAGGVGPGDQPPDEPRAEGDPRGERERRHQGDEERSRGEAEDP